MKKGFLAFVYIMMFAWVAAQNIPYYYPNNRINVYNENGKLLQYPFTGGLKHPMFGMIDLNLDGYDDLVILDRIDDRVLTYRNLGIKDSVAFLYRSQYEIMLPDTMAKTMIIKDFNNDHKPDIFTFANTAGTGIKLYKNTSTSSQISFQLMADPIKASYDTNPEQFIFVSSDDLPAIADMDNDGDLDIITFSILQGLVEYYKNLSQELYGNSDSLKYVLADECWGRFREQTLTNGITLNVVPTYCYYIDHVVDIISKNHDQQLMLTTRHAGSTFFANDLDDDGDIDVVLGDVQFPGLTQLNNGKSEFSHIRDSITSYDTLFPSGTRPVQIRQMPAISYIDLDNDSVKDMLVYPLDKDYRDTIDGLNQVWLYKNQGKNNKPKFSYKTNNFLQEQMIDLGGPTQPVFFDYDNDSDNDLLVATTGNYPYTLHKKDRIILFENTGTKFIPEFRFKNPDYLGLSAHNYEGLVITLGDIDGDKKPDLICGKKEGTISFFRNISTGDTAKFKWETDILDSIDVGYFSAPAVYDINGDMFGDLFIGHDKGEICYYLNQKKLINPGFDFISGNFAGLNFSSSNHYTTPIITDITKNGIPDLVFTHNYWDGYKGLVVGSVGFIENISADTSVKYNPVYNHIKDNYSNEIINKQLGRLLRPAFSDLDADGWPDMMLGLSRGGLMLFTTSRDTTAMSMKNNPVKPANDIRMYPNPAKTNLNIDFPGSKARYVIEITDPGGRVLLTYYTNGGTESKLDISALAAGFYLVRIQSTDFNTFLYKKLIKQ